MGDKMVPVEAEIQELPQERENVRPDNFYGTSAKPRPQRDRSWLLICLSLIMIAGSTYSIASNLLKLRITNQSDDWVIHYPTPETTLATEETIQKLVVTAEDIFVPVAGEADAVELHIEVSDGESRSPSEIYAAVSPAVVCVEVESYYGNSYCTGVVISEDGYILTATDAQTGASAFSVSFADGTRYVADCVREEWGSGLCLLKVEAKDLPTVSFAQDSGLSVGQGVYCICNPYGSQIPNVFYDGMMSAKGSVKVGSYAYTVLQTSAQRSGVGYGCPILDGQGLVVGLTTPIGKRLVSDQDPCLAISAGDLTEILAAFARAETSEYRWLGLEVAEIPEEYVYMYAFPGRLWINETPPYQNLCRYDVICSVDGVPVESLEEFERIISAHEPGDVVELIIFRVGTYYRVALPVFSR